MFYHSTRNKGEVVDSRRAIVQGLSEDGGLFVSDALGATKIPLSALMTEDYLSLATRVLSVLLDDFSPEEIRDCVEKAYRGKFSSPAVTPVTELGEDWLLELYHGPTSAFKDLALCVLPHLMSRALEKTGQKVMIATATRGDTGKAALEGFKDVPNIGISVFYPEGKVSAVQRLQMVTQEGGNVAVAAVRGNFDDVQSAVKRLFLQGSGRSDVSLSSANSINIGRLAPQVVYYFDAYRQLVEKKVISLGDPVDFSVPTGNFGDVLAGYYAKLMGLPVRHLIVASNANNVLTDFLTTGVYDRRRAFEKTISPSMDILISSNLERLLYYVSGQDTTFVADMMKALREDGVYRIPEAMLAEIRKTFRCGWADDEQTCRTIREVWDEDGVLIDTHTAVAVRVGRANKAEGAPLVVLSTASPYKFCRDVVFSIVDNAPDMGDDFAYMDALSGLTGTEPPRGLSGLKKMPERHTDVIDVDQMQAFVEAQMNRVYGEK